MSTSNTPSKMSQIIGNIKENMVTYIMLAIVVLIIVGIIIYAIYMSRLMKSQCSSMDSMYSKLDGAIRSLNSSDPNCGYFLRDYYIKSAYNCCSPGSFKNDYVSLCALKDILKQGVRCLDFEVFSVEEQPVVATTTVHSYYVKETYNSIPFTDVMTIVTNYAFSSSSSPNPQDPIIFHFRFKSDNLTMYQNLANIFKGYDNFFLGPQYSYEFNGQNLGATPILQLSQKIIVVVDKLNNAFVECNDFFEYVNMTSNSMFMRSINYSEAKNTPDITELQQYNMQNMSIVVPDTGASPQNPSGIIARELGTQMVAMMYQKVDSYLEEVNTFFDQNGYAFVLKPESLRYIQETIPDPTPQNPELSYATRTVSGDYYSFNI
jgi:Phosphatidylinositol-specific phospholipase C, X domain/Phosphatidylinositol-specific phospholipase C, Y domain